MMKTARAATSHEVKNQRSSHEHAWLDLLTHLSSRTTIDADEHAQKRELVEKYRRLTPHGRPPASDLERTAFATLRQHFFEASYEIVKGASTADIPLGLGGTRPQLARASAHSDFFRIVAQGSASEFFLLGELHDQLGRHLSWQNGSLCYPTRNPIMVVIRSKAPLSGTFCSEVLLSRAAFNEEMEINRELFTSTQSALLQSQLLPVTTHYLMRAASLVFEDSEAQGSHNLVRAVDRGQPSPPAFLVSRKSPFADSPKCLVTFSFSSDLPFPITRSNLLAPEDFVGLED